MTGSVKVGEESVTEGAAAFVESESALSVQAVEESRFMWCFGRPHGEPSRTRTNVRWHLSP
ncbi:MAG: hypothetical protein K9M17_03770 [Mariprofundaceae bacterium]|nr:hypothetical protein [Mariprofundaceae bacterium]